MRVFFGGFWGTDKTLTATAISIVTLADVRPPAAFVAPQRLLPTGFRFLRITSVRGIWIALFISNIMGVIIAWL